MKILALKLSMQLKLNRFMTAKRGVAIFKLKVYLRAVVKNIFSKFSSARSNSLRDIDVHTDRNCNIDLIEQQTDR